MWRDRTHTPATVVFALSTPKRGTGIPGGFENIFWVLSGLRLRTLHMRVYKVAVLILFACWVAWLGWKAGHRQGLTDSSLWHLEHWGGPCIDPSSIVPFATVFIRCL